MNRRRGFWGREDRRLSLIRILERSFFREPEAAPFTPIF